MKLLHRCLSVMDESHDLEDERRDVKIYIIILYYYLHTFSTHAQGHSAHILCRVDKYLLSNVFYFGENRMLEELQ